MQSISLYKYYCLEVERTPKIRQVVDVPSSQEVASFFNGVTKDRFCVVGVVLGTNEDHYFNLKLNGGYVPNTKA